MKVARRHRNDARAADAGGGVFSFHCTACGKCCNSGPQLSLPELFHHERRFIGCLTLRRVRRVKSGDELGKSNVQARASGDDERACAQLADSVLHLLPSAPGESSYDLMLATQAFYEPSRDRCPALSSEAACTIHHDRKPVACAVAPLEAWLPDRLQQHVLAGRLGASEYVGADCITKGAHADASRVLTRKLAVVQPQAHEALAARRADLANEKLFWGDAVFVSLRDGLLSHPEALARIPVDGFVSIPPAPVLAVLAAVSDRCRTRCLQFLEAQLPLIEATRKQRAEPAVVSQLDALAAAARRLSSALADARTFSSQPHAADVEAWLGLTHS